MSREGWKLYNGAYLQIYIRVGKRRNGEYENQVSSSETLEVIKSMTGEPVYKVTWKGLVGAKQCVMSGVLIVQDYCGYNGDPSLMWKFGNWINGEVWKRTLGQH